MAQEMAFSQTQFCVSVDASLCVVKMVLCASCCMCSEIRDHRPSAVELIAFDLWLMLSDT